MDEAEHELSDRDPKAKRPALQLARQRVFDAFMAGPELTERPTPGRFADPRAMMQAGMTGR